MRFGEEEELRLAVFQVDCDATWDCLFPCVHSLESEMDKNCSILGLPRRLEY